MMPVTFAVFRTFENPRRVIVTPSPETVVWNQGIQEQVMMQSNDEGELRFDEAIVTQREPAVTINFAKYTKEIMALKLGLKLVSENLTDAIMAKSLRAEKTEYPGAVAGREGFGMSADQTDSEMYALIDGISTPLTRVAFSSFNPASNNTFAQGANGAFKVAQNLVTARTWISPFFRYPITGAHTISLERFNEFSLNLIGALHQDNEKYTYEVSFPRIQINLQENSEIDFKAAPVPIACRITDYSCAPTVRFYNRKRNC